MNIKSASYFIFLLTALCFGSQSKAQHCQYDFLGLIGIAPYCSDTSKIIDGLYITLTDSIGNPIIEKLTLYNKDGQLIGNKEDSLVFWRNTKPNKDVSHSSKAIKMRHFYFARNYYVLVADVSHIKKLIREKGMSPVMRAQTFYIKIEDNDGIENGGYFKPVVIPVTPEIYLPLCRVSLQKGMSSLEYQPFFIDLAKLENLAPVQKNTIVPQKEEVPQYDSISRSVDSVRASNGVVGTVIRTAEYYKMIEGRMTIVKKQVCRDKCLNCERTDCWIYLLKDGKLIPDEFLPGAE